VVVTSFLTLGPSVPTVDESEPHAARGASADNPATAGAVFDIAGGRATY
jgi:hypothetical protein